MTKEVKARFRLKDGKLTMINRKLWEKEMLDNFSEGEIIGVFRIPKKIRSNEQNGFYFGVFVYSQIDCFKERWGEIFTVSQVHDWNKSNVWCKEIIVDDEVQKIPDTSTNKTTKEWEERLEMCRQFFMLKFGWSLPVPLTQEEIKFL